MMTGRKHSAETKLRMSKSMRGKKHVFSEEGRRNLAAAASRTHTGRKRSEETCKAISRGLTGKPKSEECKEKLRSFFTGKSLPSEHKENISLGVIKRHMELGIIGEAGFKGVHTSGKCQKEIHYRSSLERSFVEFLDHDGFVISYSYEPFSIPFQFEDYTRHYIPDFLVIREGSMPQLVETRPKRLRADMRSQCKWVAAKALCAKNGWEFVLVSAEDLPHMPTRNQAGRKSTTRRPEGSEINSRGSSTNKADTSAGQLPSGVEDMIRHSGESRRDGDKELHA